MNSLKARLTVSALFVILFILPVIGITLNSAFEAHIKASIQNELIAHSYSILAVAEVEQNQITMPEQLLENRFNVIDSGLYAFIRKTAIDETAMSNEVTASVKSIEEQTLWSSPSILSLNVDKNIMTPAVGKSLFYEFYDLDRHYFIYTLAVSFNESTQSFPITLSIVIDQNDFIKTTKEFNSQLWLWLLILGLLLIIVQVAWLLWTLKPLKVLKAELSAVETGEALQLLASYPQELEQVTQQLNALLKTEQNQRKRYRNALSNLTHSLKTPLAVIQSSGNLSVNQQEQLTVINQTIEYQLKRAQSAGESSWYLGCKVLPVVNKLLSAFEKIYQDKNITFDCNISPDAHFKGDESDLMEVLGNLIDNACKAAEKAVLIEASMDKSVLRISVEDDGVGIALDKKESILNRGMRADTYQKGHGIGLAIVYDIVDSYQGTVLVDGSKELSGAMFILEFNQ